MQYKKGEIWWADLEEPRGSEPGYRRPVVIVQSNAFNKSAINTIIVAVITSNLNLALAPGNIKLSANKKIGLNKESVVNISQLITLDKTYLSQKAGQLSSILVQELNESLMLVLDL